MKLVLGVVDIPYANDSGKGVTTTGEVAEILEAKYGVMGHFFEAHKSDVAKFLEEGMKGQLENLMVGAPPSSTPFQGALDNVDDAFRKFLDDREMERMGVPGVPTQAALGGVNHRKKARKNKPTKKNKGDVSRPSFIDTGLYQANFKSEIK